MLFILEKMKDNHLVNANEHTAKEAHTKWWSQQYLQLLYHKSHWTGSWLWDTSWIWWKTSTFANRRCKWFSEKVSRICPLWFRNVFSISYLIHFVKHCKESKWVAQHVPGTFMKLVYKGFSMINIWYQSTVKLRSSYQTFPWSKQYKLYW